jgi:NitT/TauT family transport system ATP-binding protein
VAKLAVDQVFMQFGDKAQDGVVALRDISLSVEDREFCVIVGPSGCGKSTLLRLVAGLTRPTSGRLLLGGSEIQGPSRERGMVFQSYTLFPWLTVRGNIEFGPRLKGVPASERQDIVARYVQLVGLTGFENAYPRQLSGGMMQRVAIARALANDPEILLMDEPFGALDSQTRSLMQELLLDVWEQAHKTVLFITHDIDEAIFLGDRVCVMTARPGQIKEEISIDLPRPRTPDVLMSPEFIEVKRKVAGLIREEALKVLDSAEALKSK